MGTSRSFEEKLQEDIYLLDDVTAVFKHDGVLSDYELGTMFHKLNTITNHLDQFYYIIDAQGSQEVSAEQRRFLMKKLSEISGKLIHISVVTGKNVFLNLLAKFVFGGIGFKSIKIHKTFKEAKDEILQQKNK